MPVGHVAPLHEELPLPAAHQRGGVGGVGGEVSGAGDRRGGWQLPPFPRQHLLDFALHVGTLSGRGEGEEDI